MPSAGSRAAPAIALHSLLDGNRSPFAPARMPGVYPSTYVLGYTPGILAGANGLLLPSRSECSAMAGAAREPALGTAQSRSCEIGGVNASAGRSAGDA